MSPNPSPSPAAGLSPLERAAIDLARADPLSSLRPRRRISIWLGGGRSVCPPLANARLEAVRRYAILRARAPDRLEAARRQLVELGYTPAKIMAIDALAAAPRQRPRRGRSGSGATGARMQYRAARFASAAGAALIFMFCAGGAHAQAEPPMDPSLDLPDGDGPPPGGPGGGDHFAIGIGAAYMPAYHGSDEYRFQPLPAIDIKWNRFFVNFQDGIGANLIDTETITVGAGVVMVDNYRAKDAPPGIGKVPFGAGARGFVKLRQAGFEAVLGGTQVFAGGTKGFVADASLSYPIMVSQKLMLNPSIGTTWGNRKHLNRYFGVNTTQSLASGLPEYRLKSGLIDAKAEVSAQYLLTDRIGIGLVGGMSTLMGDAKDSPIVKKRTRPYGIFFVSYSF